MKKIVLLFTGMLIGLTTVTAAESISAKQSTDLDLTSRYRYAQPILFVERGVEFLIFPDGSFDFNTDLLSTIPDNEYYERRSNTRTRRSTNRTQSAPGITYLPRTRGVLITHDRLGRVRRVGNVFVNYDRAGRIKRIGSVYMTYRKGFLKQVGGLRLQYNRHGDVIGTRGFVNHSNQSCGVCGLSGCATNHFNAHGHSNNDHDYNDDHYYYKKGDKVHKKKKRKKGKKH